MSSTALRSRSSGSSVMAALRCCALALVSFCRSSNDDAPVLRVISFVSCLYRLSSASMSSATCGNGSGAFLFQKKSVALMSYVFLVTPRAGFFSSTGVSMVTRFSFMPSTSCTRLWYVHECDSIVVRSMLRSKMISTGRDTGVPADDVGRPPPANMLSLELSRWSRSLRSSFVAMISAAMPLGQRIIGMTPGKSKVSLCRLRRGRAPMETHP